MVLSLDEVERLPCWTRLRPAVSSGIVRRRGRLHWSCAAMAIGAAARNQASGVLRCPERLRIKVDDLMAHDTAPRTGALLAATPVSMRSRWLGPALTVAAVLAIPAGRSVATISSPGLILLVLVAISAVLGGIRPALASATIASAFVAVDASAPGQLLQYDSAASSRLLVNVVAAFVMAVLVGGIEERLEGQRESARRAAQRGPPAGTDRSGQRSDPHHRREQPGARRESGHGGAVRVPHRCDRRELDHEADAAGDARPARHRNQTLPRHRATVDSLARRRTPGDGGERPGIPDRGFDRRVCGRSRTALHGHRPRHQPPQGDRNAADAGPEDGCDRAAGRGHCPRLQQPPDRDRGLCRDGGCHVRSLGSAPGTRHGNPPGDGARGLAHPPAADVQPRPEAQADGDLPSARS